MICIICRTGFRDIDFRGGRQLCGGCANQEVLNLEQKLANYLNQRKTSLQQEITLLREILAHE